MGKQSIMVRVYLNLSGRTGYKPVSSRTINRGGNKFKSTAIEYTTNINPTNISEGLINECIIHSCYLQSMSQHNVKMLIWSINDLYLNRICLMVTSPNRSSYTNTYGWED